MKKNKTQTQENYLERCPVHSPHLKWTQDDKGLVTLTIENRGFFNRISQFLFRRPKFSHIHLDQFGSFVWPLIDGQTTILQLGESVEAEFGESAHPLYERLAKFFQILDSYHFILWKKETE